MTLRKLPEIKALDSLPGEVSPIPADHALAKWKPGIHAGREADASARSRFMT
jgi:hypothetical protein